jgi:DNA (cytosine-5)-methyltransferase 1
LIAGQKRGRHLYWTNFLLPNDIAERSMKGIMCGQSNDEFNKLCKFHEYDFNKYKGKQSKTKMARNLVDFEVGKTILDTAMGIIKSQNVNQIELF